MEKRKKIWAGVSAGIILLVIGTAYTAMGHPPQPDGNVRTFQGDVTVSLSATDNDSGVRYTKIAVYFTTITEESPWTVLLAPTNFTGNLTYSAQGKYQVHFFSEDNLGNVEAEKYQTFIIWQDRTPPRTVITLIGDDVEQPE